MDKDLNNEADSKKACLLSSMEAAVSPNKVLDATFHDKDPPDEPKEYPVNGNGEHGDAAATVSQIYPARFYSKCNIE